MMKKYLKIDFSKKVFLLIALLILVFASTFAQNPYTDTPFNSLNVNKFDSVLMQPYSKALDLTGTATQTLTLLSPVFLYVASPTAYLRISAEYVETIALAYGIKELCKSTVSRARPYMYFENAPEKYIKNGDWDDSFCSGHTTLSFASAAFTTFMFCKYLPESKLKIPAICTSYALAATTAALRLASGNHFVTDVIAGAAIGSAVGVLVPLLNTLWETPKINENTEVAMSPLGVTFSVKY